MSRALPPISRIVCRAISLPENNIDSDTIVTLGFQQAPRAGAPGRACVLVTGTNFGHGTRHERAVASLQERGFQAVIAPSFGEMFLANCIYRRLLPAQVAPEVMPGLHEAANRADTFLLDVADSTITTGDGSIRRYTLTPAYRDALLHGVDENDPVWVRYREALAAYRDSKGSEK
jgi:3-isopropylmalate/(R)-2-methylmalate dehydratase small subunit